MRQRAHIPGPGGVLGAGCSFHLSVRKEGEANRMAIMKKTDNNMYRSETILHSWREKAKWYSCFGKQPGNLVKQSYHLISSNSIPRHILKREMKTYVQTSLYLNVRSSIIHNSQKAERTQILSPGDG
jgi:hypothetical protein